MPMMREHGRPAKRVAAGTPGPGQDVPPDRLTLLVQLLTVGTGIVGWATLVGAARTWARLRGAGIPSQSTLAGLGPEAFLADGLRTLLLPLALGGMVALLLYFSRLEQDRASPNDAPRRHASPRNTRQKRAAPLRAWLGDLRPVALVGRHGRERPVATAWLGAGAGVLVLVLTVALTEVSVSDLWQTPPTRAERAGLTAPPLVALVVAIVTARRRDQSWTSATVLGVGALLLGALLSLFGVALLRAIEAGMFFLMLLLTLVAAWLTLGAVAGKAVGGAALTLFVALATWSGLLTVVQELGDKKPELTTATVHRREGAAALNGFFLGRSSEHLYLAQPLGDPKEGRSVVLVPLTDVLDVVYGDQVAIPGAVSAGVSQPPTPRLPDLILAPPTAPVIEDPAGASGPVEQSGGSGGVQTDETEPPPTTPPPTTSPPRDGPVLARASARVAATRVEFQVLALSRRNRFILLEARLVNQSDREWTIGVTLGAEGRPTLEGLHALDSAGAWHYDVALGEEGVCVCDVGLDRVVLPPGGSRNLAAAFQAPAEAAPAALTALDLHVPGFGWLTGVPVE